MFRNIFAAFVLISAAVPVVAQTFSNATPVTVVDSGETTSTINVSGVAGNITGLSLSLNSLSHTYPDDLVFGLLNENLGLGYVFMSGVGGDTDINNVTLTFSDLAGGQLPESFVDAFAVSTGTYLPSNFGGYNFTFFDNAASFADFNGFSANGAWTLYVDDIFPADGGALAGGWSLNFTTDAVAPGVPEPAAWGMMTIGFGMAGATLRRRRRALALARAA